MPLHLVAVPIGDATDITARAIETLKAADVVIGEERREVSKLLKSLGIEGKQLELLNEHSKEDDVQELLGFCRTLKVALVSDCGTPGFCDPGARLVAACRSEQIQSRPVPGASSLMCLLSVTGHDMREFLFRGFLPADREERNQSLRALDREQRPIVLMDTPYRLVRLLTELAERWPERRAVLGCDFTQPSETVIEGQLKNFPQLIGDRKAEFIMVVFPGEISRLEPRPKDGANLGEKKEATGRDARPRKPFFPNRNSNRTGGKNKKR